MANNDLDTLSLAELKSLQKDVDQAIKSYAERQRREAIVAAEAAAMEKGFKLSDLMSGVKGRKARTPSPAKYRHPDKPELTWSGRGRRPEWVRELLSSGKSISDYEV